MRLGEKRERWGEDWRKQERVEGFEEERERETERERERDTCWYEEKVEDSRKRKKGANNDGERQRKMKSGGKRGLLYTPTRTS